MPSPEIGGPEKVDIVIVDYDPDWPRRFETERAKIAGALGERALQIDHVGSTSVPGLAAKPIIDIDLAVTDSADEAAYVPDLVAVGFALRVREPDWEEHRMLRSPARDVHLHVFCPGSRENTRHLLLRERLRRNAPDRELYEATKRRLAARDWPTMQHYADAKTEVVEAILARAGWDSGADPAGV
jgi:GrpB-like predicted nucleotidyltransferase (UPF0157 family)